MRGAGPWALGAAALALSVTTAPSLAAPALGPQADVCVKNQAAALVQIRGLKARSGTMRVQLYANNPKTFLEKKRYLARVDVAVPASGAVDVCVPAPGPGSYAVSVRHDINGNGKSDRSDGGGFSGNPQVSLTDMAFKRKPSLKIVAFNVGATTRLVPVTLRYVSGLSFKPIG